MRNLSNIINEIDPRLPPEPDAIGSMPGTY
jgi:hypothetical protein